MSLFEGARYGVTLKVTRIQACWRGHAARKSLALRMAHPSSGSGLCADVARPAMSRRRWLVAERVVAGPEMCGAPPCAVVECVRKRVSTAFHRAVWQHSAGPVFLVAGSAACLVVLHRLSGTAEHEEAPALGLRIAADAGQRLPELSTVCSDVEHACLDCVLRPLVELRAIGFAGKPEHLDRVHGPRFVPCAQSRTANGKRPRRPRGSGALSPSQAPSAACVTAIELQVGDAGDAEEGDDWLAMDPAVVRAWCVGQGKSSLSPARSAGGRARPAESGGRPSSLDMLSPSKPTPVACAAAIELGNAEPSTSVALDSAEVFDIATPRDRIAAMPTERHPSEPDLAGL